MAKRRKKSSSVIQPVEMEMTPMIDIVFQLLIFFLLSAKFIALEGQLSSYLPKDRGLNSSFSTVELAKVDFFYDWVEDAQGGRARLRTIGYKPADGSADIDTYEFGTVDGTGEVEYGPKRDKVSYGYHVPNFDEVEEYLRHRNATFTGAKEGLPVTINVEDQVPMQMVTNIVDACARIGISNVTIAAKEVPIE